MLILFIDRCKKKCCKFSLYISPSSLLALSINIYTYIYVDIGYMGSFFRELHRFFPTYIHTPIYISTGFGHHHQHKVTYCFLCLLLKPIFCVNLKFLSNFIFFFVTRILLKQSPVLYVRLQYKFYCL